MGIPILLFRLEGVLQSWGEHSKWDYRDTAAFPTKSGVVGLLGCAMGLERDDTRIGEISSSLRMIVRADRAGELLTDFQTISADKIYTASGGTRSGGNTIISNKSYLQDASFLVGLTGKKDLLEELDRALKNPKWSMYLGRKNCVPSVPILGEISEEYDSLEQAMQNYPLTERHDENILMEMDSVGAEGSRRPDERAKEKGLKYQDRRTVIKTIKRQE